MRKRHDENYEYELCVVGDNYVWVPHELTENKKELYPKRALLKDIKAQKKILAKKGYATQDIDEYATSVSQIIKKIENQIRTQKRHHKKLEQVRHEKMHQKASNVLVPFTKFF